jgi:NAD(P)-dependent dehydrogenase (short-subunit alcohol dehydrogenase family)
MAMTKALSREYAPDNILVNTVCLGAVKTAQWERRRLLEAPDVPADVWYDQLADARGIPLGRLGDADEAADLIAFLVSERAGYITGTAINFDGGSSWTL